MSMLTAGNVPSGLTNCPMMFSTRVLVGERHEEAAIRQDRDIRIELVQILVGVKIDLKLVSDRGEIIRHSSSSSVEHDRR